MFPEERMDAHMLKKAPVSEFDSDLHSFESRRVATKRNLMLPLYLRSWLFDQDRKAATAAAMLLACGWLSFAQQAPVFVQPGAPGEPSHSGQAALDQSAALVTPADIAFMQCMMVHHAQAVEMTALIASHTVNKALLAFGAKIGSSQSDEILLMQRWLAVHGDSFSTTEMPPMPGMDMSSGKRAPMPGMLSPKQMEALRNARGRGFDQLFLAGMIQHHRGALLMVRQLFDQPGAGQEAELFDFASDVNTGQLAEIGIMQNMLNEIQ